MDDKMYLNAAAQGEVSGRGDRTEEKMGGRLQRIGRDCRLPRYLTNPGQRRSEWDMAGSDGISRVSAVFRGKLLLTNKMRII